MVLPLSCDMRLHNQGLSRVLQQALAPDGDEDAARAPFGARRGEHGPDEPGE